MNIGEKMVIDSAQGFDWSDDPIWLDYCAYNSDTVKSLNTVCLLSF